MTTETTFSKRATTVSTSNVITRHLGRLDTPRDESMVISWVTHSCLPLSPGPSMQSKLVSNQQMDEIAAKLGAQWKALAVQLEMKAVEVREIETDSEDVEMQAKLLLVAWQDREGPQATVENLVTALNTAGFSQMADNLNEA